MRVTSTDQGSKTKEIKAKKEEQLGNHKVIEQMRESPLIQENLHSLEENFQIKDIVNKDDLDIDQGNSLITLKNNYMVANQLKRNFKERLHFWKRNFILE